MVRTHPDPPITFGGCSSIGRAPALQAGGHRFDPVHLHHYLCEELRVVAGKSLLLVFTPYECTVVLIFNKTEEVKRFGFEV